MSLTTTQNTRRARRGFTLPEVLIAMTVGMVVIVSASSFSVQSWKTRRGWTVKELVDRNARFVGLSLARDVQEAGISMESTQNFASLGTFGDTITILSVPYEPDEAPVYPIFNDGDTLPTYPPGGTCGAFCIEFMRVGGTFRVAPGDLVRLQIGSTRRLLLLTAVKGLANNKFQIKFLEATSLFNRPAGLDSVLLERSGTTIQKLNAVRYWLDRDSKELKRAERLDSGGDPIGAVMASNVENFEARLQFVSGNESISYNGLDADTLNDGNDIIGIKVRAEIRSDRSDPAVNGGLPVSRWYTWKVAPRNLLYEKNRM